MQRSTEYLEKDAGEKIKEELTAFKKTAKDGISPVTGYAVGWSLS